MTLYLLCLVFFFFFFWSLTSYKCSGVSIFDEFWIESAVLVHCYSKVFIQKTVQSGEVTICSQDHITYLPKWAPGSESNQSVFSLQWICNLISLFTHEIFILFSMPTIVCPAINSKNNKGKINSFWSVRLSEGRAEQTSHYACGSASWEKRWQPRERRKHKNPIRKIFFALYNPLLQAP